jgi:hypothetical protein
MRRARLLLVVGAVAVGVIQVGGLVLLSLCACSHSAPADRLLHVTTASTCTQVVLFVWALSRDGGLISREQARPLSTCGTPLQTCWLCMALASLHSPSPAPPTRPSLAFPLRLCSQVAA